MTPRELFTFAARLRTNLATEQEIAEHVEKIIKRLGLKNCADSYIGGKMYNG